MANKYGKWINDSSLSEGGQASIFHVYEEGDEDKNLFVLKRFKKTDRLERHKNEVQAALDLDHPNVIKHIDSDLECSKPYMVVENCPDGPLSQKSFEDYDTVDRLKFFRVICDGVGHAHSKGIFHRDIKPENIFLKDNGKTPVVGDFGICFISGKGKRITLIDEAVGARRFTAPELEDGRSDKVSARSDVYSLGKILYWMFAGRVFDREKHRDPNWNLTNRDLSDTKIYELAFVNELLDKSIVFEPEKRFSNANHFGVNVDRTIWRIQRHCHVLDLNEIQICDFCGKGHYQLVGDTTKGDEMYGIDDVERFGIRHVDSAEWLVLWCNHCGHVQYFRTDIMSAKNQNPWKKYDE